jgi:nicotinamidase-related amidase
MSGHLVVIDVQNVFGDPDSPWFCPRFDEILEPIERLVAAYEPRVTFTRFVAPPEPVGAWQAYYRQWPWALQPGTADLYALTPRFAGRPTLDAPTFGKWGPALSAAAGDELVVAGVSTDCCVLSTVLPAADAGVRVRVAADACAGAGDDTHQQALALMGLYAPLVEIESTATLS